MRVGMIRDGKKGKKKQEPLQGSYKGNATVNILQQRVIM